MVISREKSPDNRMMRTSVEMSASSSGISSRNSLMRSAVLPGGPGRDGLETPGAGRAPGEHRYTAE